MPAAFEDKPFRTKKAQEAYEKTFVGWYQKLVKRNSFIYLGIPMIGSVVLGSILLSNFTAIRYEQRDAKVQELDESDLLSHATNKKRKVDLREEYYKLQGMNDEMENWQQKRVPRMKGESDNIFR